MDFSSSWGETAKASGGKLALGNPTDLISSLSTDSRTLKKGDAFWALKGPRFNAHDFLNQELAENAGGWIVESGAIKNSALRPKHLIEVPNSLKALQALARWHRQRFPIPVVGITGSNGKTTTKEMLRSICEKSGPTCASPGNWNNQIGVPLSVLQLERRHRFGIFELADSKPGDIREIALIAQPTLGLITNIGSDHMEFYDSLEENFQTKAELIECLPAEGRVVLNADDPWLSGLERKLGNRAVSFGLSAKSCVSFSDSGEMLIDRRKVRIHLAPFGRLSRYNAAAAAAAAWALGIDIDIIRQGLESFRPGAMRLEPFKHPSGCEVILDAYNANPSSMKASIEAFCGEFSHKSKILALGDMKELGRDSPRFHKELGEWVSGLPLKSVYLAGPEMAPAYEALSVHKPPFAVHYSSQGPEEWIEPLKKDLGPSCALMIKASRAMQLESVWEKIKKS